jgi:hypothetical protein
VGATPAISTKNIFIMAELEDLLAVFKATNALALQAEANIETVDKPDTVQDSTTGNIQESTYLESKLTDTVNYELDSEVDSQNTGEVSISTLEGMTQIISGGAEGEQTVVKTGEVKVIGISYR